MLRWNHRIIAVFRVRSHQTQSRLKSTRPKLEPANQFSRHYNVLPKIYWPPRSAPARYFWYTSGSLLAGHILLTYFITCAPAYGISMLPTISSWGDWVFLSKYYRRGRDVKVGDVVSFKHPVNIGESAIKRIVGMEGDFVLMYTPEKNEMMLQVPEGHCWVTGDNLQHSRDSRMFGPLPLALVQGKVQAKINFQRWWPDFTWVDHDLRSTYLDEELD